MTNAYTSCQHPRVKHFAKAFWQMQGKPSYQTETILPKGVVELIFSFNDPVAVTIGANETRVSTARCFISGMSDRRVELHVPIQQSFFGIELHPVAVKKLLKVPSGTFLNTITDLTIINTAFNSLWHQLGETDLFEDRVAIAQEWIGQRISPIHEQEMTISSFIAYNPESVTVAGLASQFYYSTRQLNRKVQELFGMSTEGLIRYRRYIHSLQQVHYSPKSLTRVSYDCFYYDQAHFIREFKDFTGLTPGEYRQQKSTLAGHLYEF